MALLVVESVPHDELVRDLETDVADRNLDDAGFPLGEQRANSERTRVAALQRLEEIAEGESGVDDVLDDQHVASF